MPRLQWFTTVLVLVVVGTGGPAAVEQTVPGPKPPAALVASFDGLGAGFIGPQGSSTQRNPSDNSVAVGPDRVMQIVNTRLAIFTKSGTPLYGPVETKTLFRDFGGPCEIRNNGDAVVRYDQLAGRWLIVMPIFSRGPLRDGPQPGPPVSLPESPDLSLQRRAPRAEGRARTRCAMRSAPEPIRWVPIIAINSPGRCFQTIRGPRCGPTAITSPPAPATT